MVRALKFQMLEEEGLYYLHGKNKGTDQLHGNHAADLQLCFCLCKIRFSHDAANRLLIQSKRTIPYC